MLHLPYPVTSPSLPCLSAASQGPRALGGGPLAGDSLMRLVYIDEAGLSNPDQEPFLVVAGVVIHADKNLVAVERALDKVIARHIRPEHQDGFILHAKELFNGGGRVFTRNEPQPYPLSKRLEIADDITAIVTKFRLPIALGFLERGTFPDDPTYEEWRDADAAQRTVISHVVAFMSCTMFVEQWMRKEASNEVCLLVVEDNQQARTAIRENHLYHQDPNIAKFLTGRMRNHFPFRKIKEEPLFQPKRPSSVLQLADFCAYVGKRMLMEKDAPNKKYERFSKAILANAITINPTVLP